MPETLQTIVVLQALAWIVGVVAAFLYGRHYQRKISTGMTKDQILDSDKASVKQLIEARKAQLLKELEELGINVPK